MPSLARAIQVLHERYGVPHIVITSVSLPPQPHPTTANRSLSVVGSTMTSSRRARAFQIVFPAIDCYFSGTGDMFAALTVVRMREAVWNTPGGHLGGAEAWRSADDVDAPELPLARAVERVLASMHEVLTRTRAAMGEGAAAVVVNGTGAVAGAGEEKKKAARLVRSKAAELRLVRHLDSLRFPKVQFRAVRV
jgi:pyridoxine kinase